SQSKIPEKRIKDNRDFPEVFPEDFPGLPPTRQVEFHIELIPRAAPVVRAPYRLAPTEMKDLAEQLKELSNKGFEWSSHSDHRSEDDKQYSGSTAYPMLYAKITKISK
ncbi:hypothetical protein Tco_0240046, partial [Tanacetum coccineum]